MDRLLYNERKSMPTSQSITNIQEGSGGDDMKDYTDKMMSHLQEEGMIDPVAFAFLEKAMRGKGVRSVGRAIRGQLGKVKGAVLGGIKEDESGLGAIIQKGANLLGAARRTHTNLGDRLNDVRGRAAALEGRVRDGAAELEERARGGAAGLERRVRDGAAAVEERARSTAEGLEGRARSTEARLNNLRSQLGSRVRTAAENKERLLLMAKDRAEAGLGEAESSISSSVGELVPRTKRSIPGSFREPEPPSSLATEELVPRTKRLIPGSWRDPREVIEEAKLGVGDSGRMEKSARLIPNRRDEPMNAEEERLEQQRRDDYDNGVMRRQEEGGGRQGRSLATFEREIPVREGEEELAETFGEQPSESLISRLRALGQRALKTKAGKELHEKLKGDTPDDTSDNVIGEMIRQARGEQSAAGKKSMAAMASAIQDDPEAQGVLDRFSAKHPELVERLKKRRRNQAQLEGGTDDTYEGELGHSGAKSFKSSPAERLARSGATQEEFSQSKSVVNKLPYNPNEAMEVRSGYYDYAKPISSAAETPDSIGALPDAEYEGADAKVGDFYLPPIPNDEFAGAEERGVDLGEEMKPMGRGGAIADSRGFGQSYAERQEALRGFGGFGSSLDRTAQQQADPNVGNDVSDLGVRPAAVGQPLVENEYGEMVAPKLDEFGQVIKPKVGFAGDGVLREAPVINANLPESNKERAARLVLKNTPKDNEFGVPMRPKRPLAKPNADGKYVIKAKVKPKGELGDMAEPEKPILPKFDAPIPQPKRPAVGLESPEDVAARVAKRAGPRRPGMDDDAPNIEDIPENIISGTESSGYAPGVLARPSGDKDADSLASDSRFSAAAAKNNADPPIKPDDDDPLKSISSALTNTGEDIENVGAVEDLSSIPELALPGVDVASLTGDIATAGLGALTMGAGWLLGKVGDLAGDIKSRTATTLAPTLQLGKTITSYATQFGTEQ